MVPERENETLFRSASNESGPDPLNSSEVIHHLQEIVKSKKRELLTISVSSLALTNNSNAQNALLLAKKAREQCRTAKQDLQGVSNHYQAIHEAWYEITRRQRILQQLRSTVLSVQRLRRLADNITKAKDEGDHPTVSRLCAHFESLNAAPRTRMDETFACLKRISERVTYEVAASMRMLRSSLRMSCKRFDPDVYAKCVRDFYSLGAGSHFPSHVMQVFEEESTHIFKDALALDARPSQKVISFFSMLSGLLSQLICVFRFHSQPRREETFLEDEEIRQSVIFHFSSCKLPFRHFSELAVSLISELELSLLSEQTTNLLQVFEAVTRFCELAALAIPLPPKHKADGTVFRAKTIVNIKKRTDSDLHQPASVNLRRGGSQSHVALYPSPISRRLASRRDLVKSFEEPISASVKRLALDCLASAHARHAEELKILMNSAQCWVRIRLTEADTRNLLEELFSGIQGRLKAAVERKISKDMREKKSKVYFEDLLSSSMTFTPATLSMLRWVSEYTTVGISVPESIADAIGNVIDIFLILVNAAVKMLMRIEYEQSESFMKFMEDLLMERPAPRILESFLDPKLLKMYAVFINRYGTSDSSGDEQDEGASNWAVTRQVQLPSYTYATGNFFSLPIAGHEGIVKQCVGAEGLGTLCAVLDVFLSFVETLLEKTSAADGLYLQRVASLRSALLLAKGVQRALYSRLAWDIVGGWEAVSAVAETCRSFHQHSEAAKSHLASTSSLYVREMISRITAACQYDELPPAAAEQLSMVICETAMDVVLEGFSRVQHCSHIGAASQVLVDVRTLDLALVEHTGIHPCPGRERTEGFIKATFLSNDEKEAWAEKNRRKFSLSDDHIRNLLLGCDTDDVPVVDQIIPL